jgi:hypothetical protein
MARVLAVATMMTTRETRARVHRGHQTPLLPFPPISYFLIPLPRCPALEIQHKQIPQPPYTSNDDELACCPLQLPIVNNMANLSDDTLHKVRLCIGYTMVRAVS